jgi:O-antigen ligase
MSLFFQQFRSASRLNQLLLVYLFCLPWVSLLSARALGSILLIPMAIYSLGTLWQLKRWPFSPKQRWHYAVLCLFVLGLASCFYASHPAVSLRFFWQAAGIILLLVLFISALSRAAPHQLVAPALVLGTCVGLVLLAIQQLFSFSIIIWLNGDEPEYWNVYLNRGRVVLTLIALVVIPVLLKTKARRWASLLLIATVPLILTGESGTASLALLLGITVYSACLLLGPRLVGGLFFGSVALLLACLPFIYGPLQNLLNTIAPLWGVETSFARLELWSILCQKILESPLIGYGFEGARQLALSTADTKFLTAHTQIYHPHNAILQIWIEFGAVGVALAHWGLWLGWRALTKLPNQSQTVILCCLASSVMVLLTGYDMWQPWLLCALIQSVFLAVKLTPEAISHSQNS